MSTPEKPISRPLRHGRFYASDDDVLDAIDYWHDHEEELDEHLHDFLGWTWEEYRRFVEVCRRPMPPKTTPESYVNGTTP
jgi:hypothetical protein